MRPLITALLVTLACGLVLASTPRPIAEAPVAALALTATPVALNTEDAAARSLGPLRYLGGLQLSAGDGRFGGISGLRILGHAPGRLKLLAHSDAASWFTLDVAQDAAGAPTGILAATVQAMRDEAGQTMGKSGGDSEALSLLPDATGGVTALVAFEGEERLLAFDLPANPSQGLPAARARHAIAGLGPMPSNGGPEALAFAAGANGTGRLLIVSEQGRGPNGSAAAVLADWPGGDGDVLRFGVRLEAGFRPTDAVWLEGQRYLLLTRRFSPFTGVAAQLCLLDVQDISDGDAVTPRVLATLAPPYTVDNMEALDIIPTSEGWHVVMMSDDNFNGLQRTLLLAFDLPRAAVPENAQPD